MTAARVRTRFSCTACGATAPRWGGRCPSCEAWNTLVEEVVERGAASACPVPDVRSLAEVAATDLARRSSGIDELDRLLGGGVVPGSIALVAGEPGVGKSTLLLQVAGRMAVDGRRVLYLAGEESPAQIRLRAERLGIDQSDVLIAAGTAVDGLLAACRQASPEIIVCDSIQTVYDPALSSAPGSVSQVRAAADAFHRHCKTTGSSVFLVGHVTKEGGIAGPKTLEHVVDVVLQFEGDHHHELRVLRALKNRYGSTHEIAVFTMHDGGLEVVGNPSAMFLGAGRDSEPVPGSAHVASVQGTRPLVIEIQALVASSPYSTPQRVAGGFDARRLSLLLAVLEKKADCALGASDVFLNVVG
ncbi:MAG: DNA repair protein RadA, partial [Gemmatimonadota bacterium]